MTRVVVVGAGGHGCVVVDIVLAMQRAGGAITLLGLLDEDESLHGTSVLGVSVLGNLGRLGTIAHDAIVVAVGENAQRERLTLDLERRGERFAIARHPSAVVGMGTTIGDGAMICAGAVVGPESRIGRGTILNTACSVDHHNAIGPFSHIAPGAHCGGSVSVGHGALVGIGASILPGLRVGRSAIVGAAAVVTRDVGEGLLVVGAPAKAPRERP